MTATEPKVIVELQLPLTTNRGVILIHQAACSTFSLVVSRIYEQFSIQFIWEFIGEYSGKSENVIQLFRRNGRTNRP
jgi:hypothetical protein